MSKLTETFELLITAQQNLVELAAGGPPLDDEPMLLHEWALYRAGADGVRHAAVHYRAVAIHGAGFDGSTIVQIQYYRTGDTARWEFMHERNHQTALIALIEEICEEKMKAALDPPAPTDKA